MEILTFAFILGFFSLGESYTKYGRSCKDIGCPSNQECVMETDPCSYYQRQGECGSYPTCKRISNAAARTCATYVCPPTKVCKMDGDTPKCFDDHSQVGHVGYNTHSQNVLGQHSDASVAGTQHNQPSGNLYPSIPRGETTPRPNIHRNPVGGGYQGGQIGSGYPGQQNYHNRGGYPQQYPTPGGYPGYPQSGYPQGGYQQSGYPQGGYSQGGYPQGGYQQGYGRPSSGSSSGSSFTDQLTNSFKAIGTDILKNALTKAFSGKN